MFGKRASTRLVEFDYRFGTFFVSLVCERRNPLFGQIVHGEVQLTAAGQIVQEEWLRTPIVRPSVQLDEYIVMPDHFQAIVTIDNGHVGGASWRPCPINGQYVRDNTERIQSIQPEHRSLARMISQFKATTTKRINDLNGTSGTRIWQRGYHDRIIRNEVELDKVRKYIRNNPKNG